MRIAIIGAGMAGASLAYSLSSHASIHIIEAESQPAFHATGRSAALYAQSYGNPVIRQLTSASQTFYTNPPKGFHRPLLVPRGALFVARPGEGEALQTLHADISSTLPDVQLIDSDQACALQPLLFKDAIAGGLYERDSRDMDVDAILQGYLKGAREEGAQLILNARIDGIEPVGEGWRLSWPDGSLVCDLIVNAAGAWADGIADLAGVRPCNIQPKRRTAFLVEAPATALPDAPICVDLDETFYVKPEAGKLLCSPADETPSEPMDAYPEDLDIAEAVERIQGYLDLPIRRIASSWAGLRSFAPDRTPVVGFDPQNPRFFWLAGQGGYGIQTAPAMAGIAAHLISGQALDLELDAGSVIASLSPSRFS